MLDFEEYSAGHQDLRANKYYSAVNVCPSPTIMDMLLSAGDSLSFQEMLDIDIKSEIDDVLGSHNEFTSFSFSDLPPLDLDDSPSDLNMWFTTSNSNQSNSNFNIDFIGSEAAAMMVNPNSVMPLALVTVPTKTISPASLKPAASAPASTKALNFAPNAAAAAAAALKDIKAAGVIKKDPSAGGGGAAHAHIERRPLGKTIKIQSAAAAVNKSLIEQKSVLNIKNAIQKQFNSANPGFTNVRVVTQRKQQFHHASANRLYSSNNSEKAYPKPAYSYSCLIAMALKNSRTGSLPVSEIYNFMCDHFPYFKTAPNGWKNSVRHNLSLNKCFEKIEKPAVSGAQRKGCLWAMNPAKIGKMDEEVQKWSRKDPSAIRRAMINPDHLESLERGELKYNCRSDVEDSYGDSSADTEEEDGSDVEVEDRQEMEDIAFVNVNAPTDDECGFDIEVADTIYETASGTGTIKIEMEVVDDELIAYDDSPSSKKRSRSILELEDDFTNSRIYQLHTQSRRKTAYYIKNE